MVRNLNRATSLESRPCVIARVSRASEWVTPGQALPTFEWQDISPCMTRINTIAVFR